MRDSVLVPACVALLSVLLFKPLLHASAYVEAKELSAEQQASLKPLQRATFGIVFKPGLQCTGVYVGKGGEALTNLHCLEPCLVAKGLTKDEPAYEKPLSGGSTLNKSLVSLPEGQPAKCRARLTSEEGTPVVADVEVMKIFGPGFIADRNLLYELALTDFEAYLKLHAEGFESSGDLALIKVPQLENTACAGVRFENFKGDKRVPVTNLAYTTVLRGNGDIEDPTNIKGNRKRGIVSYGEASANNSVLSQFEEALFLYLVPPGTVLTSTDADGGSSGSPIFDGGGDVIAITRLTTNEATLGVFKDWSTQAVDLSYHRGEFEKLASRVEFCGTISAASSTSSNGALSSGKVRSAIGGKAFGTGDQRRERVVPASVLPTTSLMKADPSSANRQ